MLKIRCRRFSQITSKKKEIFLQNFPENSECSKFLGFSFEDPDCIPKTCLSFSGKFEHLKNSKKMQMGFKEEMQSLFHIKGKMSENRFEQLIKEIYLPKMKTKFHSPYIYQGEVDWQRQSHLRRRR